MTNVHVMNGMGGDEDDGRMPDLTAFTSGLASVIDEIDHANLVTDREFRSNSRSGQRSFHGPAGAAYATWYGTGSAPDGGSFDEVGFGVMHPRSELPMNVRSLHLAEPPSETRTLRRFAIALLDLTLGAIDGDLKDVSPDVRDASLEACHTLRGMVVGRRGPEVVRTYCSFPLLGSMSFVQGMKAGSPLGLGAPVDGLPEAASLWIKRERNLWVTELRPFTTSSLVVEEPDPMRRLRRIRNAEEMGMVVGPLNRRRRTP
jgi:hypothetical protein